MLVLGRKEGEVICIGNDIKVMFVRYHKGTAIIGIEAPRELVVLRKELVKPLECQENTHDEGQ